MEKLNPSSNTLVDPLTRRELAILAHLVEDKSNREIAELETLAPNSVKWYVQQIFTKLGVNRRNQVTERARELGLLSFPKSSETTHFSLPTGTVTFLFTDIVDSTPLWEQHPNEMAASLKVHNTILRQSIEMNGGMVFKVVGDAFQAVFPTALLALRAAVQGQQSLQAAGWNELGQLKVRMGLHTGEAELDPNGDEYAVSHTKNRASRIMSAANGGQILLSAETSELVNHQLPPEVSLKDLGEHHMKGMARPEHLYQLAAPGLAQEFPWLASAILKPNNLPVQMTSFIGREREISELSALLVKHRLVTLTGSGGTGKTRLALRVAEERLDHYPDGTWLVELATLADPLMVPQAVLATVGLIEQAGKTPVTQLKVFLKQKLALLVLDNCEHLVKACAELADGLLRAAPRLTILASSREILGVEGETPYRVPPLGMPDPHRLPPLDELTGFDAVRLFVERAQGVEPGFILTEDKVAAVVQITQRLDGIPLAIELAAARVRLLSAGQIAERLNDAFRLLTGGARTVLPRHQTLTALIDWSYNLLSEDERKLLRGLSAFAGGWSLEAAEEVCGGSPDVLNLLGRLVDKSLILAAPAQGGEMRYRMLETIRQYAHARLVEAGEAMAVRTRHLACYLHQAERLEPNLRGREQVWTLDYWESELDNLRLALEWGLQMDVEAELRLAASLQWFWHIRYHWSEGIAWLEQGLEVEALTPGSLPTDGPRLMLSAKALTTLGFHLLMRDRFISSTKAMIHLEEAVKLYRSGGPQYHRGLAWALLWLWSGQGGGTSGITGNPARTGAQIEEALSLFRETGDSHGIAECLQSLGGLEIDPAQKRKFHLEQLAVDEANGDTEGIATALFQIGYTNFLDGDYANAYTTLNASREHYRQVGNPDMINTIGLGLTWVAHFQGNLEQAAQYIEETLSSFIEQADEIMFAVCLWWKCMLALTQGRYDQVSNLNDQAFQIAHKTGNPLIFTNVFYFRARLAHIQGDALIARQHGEEALTVGCELGSEMVLAMLELCHLALQDEDLSRASALCREGLQVLIHKQDMFAMSWVLDGLAVLAVCEGKLDRAARLFGTRFWRGVANTFSPIERAWREHDIAKIKAALGEERFEQLRAEGQAMSYMQIMALMQEEG